MRSDHDHNMYYKTKNGNILILLLYVDDLLLTENLDEKIQLLKEQLLATFEMMDLGKVFFYLGIEFVYLLSCIFLTQRGYIWDMLVEFGMEQCKLCNVPMHQNFTLE